MSSKIENPEMPLSGDEIQSILHSVHKRLNISVDFDRYEPPGLQFWSVLEADLIKALGIGSIEDIEEGRKALSRILEQLITEQEILVAPSQISSVLDQLVDRYFGFGVIEVLLRDDSVPEIMVNGSQDIYFERRGRLQRASLSFWSEAYLRHVINRLCARNNVALPSDVNPIKTFSLADSSSVLIVFPPVTTNSPSFSIRRFTRNPITIDQLIQLGVISAEMLHFLKAAVEARLNILVSGHFGAGAIEL